MARTRRRRQYGSGCLLKRGRGWAIRWRELEIAPDGTVRRALRYEALGAISRGEAGDILAQRLAAAGNSKAPTRSRVTFRTLAAQWQAHVLPMYKHSTQKNHRHILEKHLLPHFGDEAITEVTRQRVQAYVARLTQAGYAPKSIDHIHDVLSAVLRTAVKWGHLQDNPARDVDLPALKTVRLKWALTITQAAQLLQALPPLGRTMAGLAMLSGLRRGELFALRWRDVDEPARCLTVREAVYEGTFDTPKDRGRGSTDSTVGHGDDTVGGLESSREGRPIRRVDLLDVVWQAHFAEQRAAPTSLPGVCGAGPQTGDMAYASTHLLIVGSRKGSAGQGRGSVDGSHQGGHDVERVHPGHRRCATHGGRQGRIRIVHNCSQSGKGRGAKSLI